jgi:hypothetical protein
MAKPSTTTQHANPPELDLLAERFRIWRARRQRGERIPKELWEAAIGLARIHGLNPIGAALKLNYNDLHRRFSGGFKQRPSAPAFVELAAPALIRGCCEGATVELAQVSGSRLTLRFPDAVLGDLMPLVELFLRHRS